MPTCWHSGAFYESVIPKNMAFIRLPPYSPELNPAEQIWNILRRDYFANRVFDALDAATNQAESGLTEMAANKSAIRKLTNWPWISAILKANWNENNLSRPNRGLTVRRPNGIRIKRTPAMAAALVDRVWPLAQILAYPQSYYSGN